MELLMDMVLSLGEDEFYRTSRYKTPLLVMLINSTDKDIFDTIYKNIRKTDIVQQLGSELYVVFLSHTDYNASVVIIDKIKEKSEFTYTIGEYKGSRHKFIENLFLENAKKLIYSI